MPVKVILGSFEVECHNEDIITEKATNNTGSRTNVDFRFWADF